MPTGATLIAATLVLPQRPLLRGDSCSAAPPALACAWSQVRRQVLALLFRRLEHGLGSRFGTHLSVAQTYRGQSQRLFGVIRHAATGQRSMWVSVGRQNQTLHVYVLRRDLLGRQKLSGHPQAIPQCQCCQAAVGCLEPCLPWSSTRGSDRSPACFRLLAGLMLLKYRFSRNGVRHQHVQIATAQRTQDGLDLLLASSNPDHVVQGLKLL